MIFEYITKFNESQEVHKMKGKNVAQIAEDMERERQIKAEDCGRL